MFNINDSPVRSSLHTVETATRPHQNNANDHDNDSVVTATATTIVDDEENKRKALWQELIRHFISRDLTNAMLKVDELLQSLAPIDTIDTNLCKACAFFIRATIMTCHINESFLTLYDNNEINELIEKAELFATNTWKGLWCKAIGYWILCGGAYSNGCSHRDFYLSQSFEYALQTKYAFLEYVASQNNQPSSSTATNASTNIPVTVDVCLRMIELFLRHLSVVCSRDGYIQSSTVILSDEEAELLEREYQYHWLNFIDVMQINSDVLTLSGLTEASSVSNRSISTLSPNYSQERDLDTELSSNSSTSSHVEEEGREVTPVQEGDSEDNEENQEDEEDEGDEENEEDEESFYTRVMSGQIVEEDTDFDLEAMNILRYNANLSFDTDVGVVKPRMKYVGHCNIETVKDVGFYGLCDEYIVSGSDRGHLFIWDKKTADIVQILQADEDVVNVAKGHPFLPILAVSGIDSTVKIFKPTSRLPTSKDPKSPNAYSTSSRLYKKDQILASNGEFNTSLSDDIYMTRSMYAAFLRMGRQRNLLFNEEEDSDFSSNSSGSA